VPERQNELIADALEQAVVAGEESVRRGPELLPVLKEAGVVDAGGYAVVILFAGVVAALRGSEAPELAHHARPLHTAAAGGSHASETYRYCTNFAVSGAALDQRDWAAELSEFGDSLLVVGDERTLKIHVHTDQPDRATALFAQAGEVSHLDVADMHLQVKERAARLATETRTDCGAVAVVSSDGIAKLFHGLGVATLDGGPTLNPSTTELAAAIDSVPAESVVVFANSANVVMAAERAAELSDRPVSVLRTTSQQAGLSAAVALLPAQDLETNVAALQDALALVRVGGVAPAAREDPSGRFTVGEAVGFVDDELIAWGEPEATLRQVLDALATDAELLTCISGDGAPITNETLAAMVPGDVELELSDGGQPSWWWLLAAE
jgi:dihydroxyacetone kinase-like predicted kinase